MTMRRHSFCVEFFCAIILGGDTSGPIGNTMNMKDLSNKETLEKIMNLYLNDVYRMCFYFTKDEEVSSKMTVNVFKEFYESMLKKDMFHVCMIKQNDKTVLRGLTRIILKHVNQQKTETARGERTCDDVKEDSRVSAE